jgi:Tfp pilus assembly protein PilX
MATEAKKSLLEQILEKGSEFLKKPFVLKRANRAFESALDSLEEKLMDNEAKTTSARESFVDSAKNEGSLTSSLNKLIELQQERISINDTIKAIKAEKEAFLG